MALWDYQIKPFKNDITNTLFNYNVEIQADPEFVTEMNKSACVKEKGANSSSNVPEESRIIEKENTWSIES